MNSSDVVPVIATGALSVGASVGAEAVNLYFNGQLNEDFDYTKVLGVLENIPERSVDVRIDVKDVQRINSCGVRSWILFLERVQSKFKVSFTQVGEVFIEQAGIVPTMLGGRGTQVSRFEVPYFCSSCNVRSVQTLEAVQVREEGDGFVYPSFPCPNCGNPMELESLPEEYFAFLRRSG